MARILSTHRNIATNPTDSVSPKPVVKWAGGKRQLLPVLSQLVPKEFGTYHEPFFGGGALYFHMWSTRGHFPALLLDMNPDLTNAYRIIRDDLDALIPLLGEHELKHSERHYYATRELEPSDLVERAARFLYLNKTCFNGLYRVNSKGKFNVPMGDYKNPSILEEDNLRAASHALDSAKLEEADFSDIVEEVTSGDFVYLDPPYYPTSRTANFTGYVVGADGRANFGPAEHQRLAEVVRVLDKKGCFVLISNSETQVVRKLYRDFSIQQVKARRNINSNGSRRTGVTEVVIKNY